MTFRRRTRSLLHSSSTSPSSSSLSPVNSTFTSTPRPHLSHNQTSTPFTGGVVVCTSPTNEQVALLSAVTPRFTANVRAMRRRVIGYCKRQIQIRGDFLLVLKPTTVYATYDPYNTTHSHSPAAQHPFNTHVNDPSRRHPDRLHAEEIQLIITLPTRPPSHPPHHSPAHPVAFSFPSIPGAPTSKHKTSLLSATFSGNVGKSTPHRRINSSYSNFTTSAKQSSANTNTNANTNANANTNPFTKFVFASAHAYQKFIACLPSSPHTASQAGVSSAWAGIEKQVEQLLSSPQAESFSLHGRFSTFGQTSSVSSAVQASLLSTGRSSKIYRFSLPPSPSSSAPNTNTNNNDAVAVKVVRKAEAFNADGILSAVVNERLALQALHGAAYIPRLRHAFQTPRGIALATELCAFGDLNHLVRRLPRRLGRRLPLHVARRIFAELTVALAEVHRHGMLYRDMKLSNVLLTHNGRVRITDFGLIKSISVPSTALCSAAIEKSTKSQSEGRQRPMAHAHTHDEDHRTDPMDTASTITALSVSSYTSSSSDSEHEHDDDHQSKHDEQNEDEDEDEDEEIDEEMLVTRTTSFVGTRRYMSPELSTCTTSTGKPYGTASDVWALGVVLFTLVTGTYPFSASRKRQQKQHRKVRRCTTTLVDDDGGVDRLAQAIQTDDLRIPHGLVADDALRDLLRKMLRRDAVERIDLPGIRKHPWLADIDWRALKNNDTSESQEVLAFLREHGVDKASASLSGNRRDESTNRNRDGDRVLDSMDCENGRTSSSYYVDADMVRVIEEERSWPDIVGFEY